MANIESFNISENNQMKNPRLTGYTYKLTDNNLKTWT